MIYNIDFNVCALFLTSAMLFVFYYKKWIPSLQNKIFSLFLWFCLIATIADISDGMMTSYKDLFPLWIREVALYVYFISINTLSILYAIYAVVIAGLSGKLAEGIRRWYLGVPIAIDALVIGLNPFLKCLFYFDEQRNYIRETGYLILHATAFYFMGIGIWHAYHYRNIIIKEKRIALYSFPVFALFPVLLQLFFPHILITLFGICLCLFLIFMTIQKPEDVMSGTGLLNKNALFETAGIYLKRKEEFVAISVHIHNYQYLKSVFGVETMVNCLCNVARELDHFYIKGKKVYYAGRGRFVFLLPLLEMREEFPDKIMELFEREVGMEVMNLKFSAEARVIYCPEDAESVDSLMLYIDCPDKNSAKKQSVYFVKDMNMSSRKRIEAVEKAVEKALNTESLLVYYQPIYSIKGKRVNSAEALVRLQDDELGMIFPDEFIPISEKNGSIIRIGEYVFRNVCRFIKENNTKSYGIDYIEINLSVVQCMQKKLAESLLNILEEYGIPAEYVNLEITESVAVSSKEAMEDTMSRLGEKGVQFSLDDYGSGFSNMLYLIDFPFSIVKMDRGIISKLDNPRTQIIVKNSIAMFKRLNLNVVAEGVEEQEQVELLEGMGCDFIQGYYYSRPVPETQFLKCISDIHKKVRALV